VCGIAGIVDCTSQEVLEHDVRKLLAEQLHRGPEGVSVESVPEAAFGLCRLAFVEDSSQPYVSPSGRLLVVFNGEIYNHRELRRSLTASGVEVGPGEAAVVAALYSARGAGMAEALNGMFAIAIHDARRRETLLFRDRFGKKPLSYATLGRGLVFASELSGLRAHPRVSSQLDARAVALYLACNAVPAPATLLREVRKVRPGSVVRHRDGVTREEAWWLPRVRPTSVGAAAAEARLDGALTRAVSRRIPEGMSFGVFLSGGLDSGLVAAVAAPMSPRPLRTYSIGFPGMPSYDESAQAARLASLVGASHLVVPLDLRRLADDSLRWLTRLDEPVADPSFVATAVLADAARADVKAVLTGDGADELAMGYRLFAAAAALRTLQRVVPTAVVESLLERVGARRPSDQNLHYAHVAKLLARTLRAPPERQYSAAAAAVPPAEWASILTADVLAEARTLDPYAEIDRLVRGSPRANDAERLQLGMICHFLRDVILVKLDRATMLASLEARSPFLDDEVSELLLAIPSSSKLRGLTTKYVVKRVAERYLPRASVYQRKRGFRVPVAPLLRGPLRGWLTDLLAAPALRDSGLFQPQEVERRLSEHLLGRADHHRLLWSLACLQAWVCASRSRADMPRLAA
jgi:asparagine synthase (glutamine-hydrolysing)